MTALSRSRSIWAMAAVASLPSLTTAQAPVRVDVKCGAAAEAIHEEIVRRVPGGFAGAIIVETDGIVVLKAGYGWANRESRVPFTTSTIAQVGSLTKQFTAAAIVDLSLQGKMALSDPLATYLDQVPGPASRMTLHQLLTHTAGLPDACGGDFERVTREEVITRCLARIDSSPGGSFAYSNLGYSVVAAVFEQVSGEPIENYLVERFFRPLGMTRTAYFYSDALHDSLALGYADNQPQPPISDRLRTLTPAFWNLKGNGGMQASVADMYTWYRALVRGPVISDSLRRALITPRVQRDADVAYAYGWFVRSRADGEIEQVSHTGGDGVFFAAFVWRPLDRTFFYLVTNSGNDLGADLASRVLRVLRDGASARR